MSRYRKIEVRTWADSRFRELSPIPPCGQGLWFYLLTGPHTGPIPGLFRAGRAAMAEELDWPLEDFDKAFAEAFDKGMVKADFKARVVWLPKAIYHNKPESPNVVRGWRVELDLIPDCALKSEAIAAIRDALESFGNGFVAAFDEICPPIWKASRKPSGKPSAKTMPNQEQEQEQDKELESANADLSAELPTETPPASAKPAKPARPPCPHDAIIAAYHEILPELPAVRSWTDTRRKHLQARWRESGERQEVGWWQGFFSYVRRCPWLMGCGVPGDGRSVFRADLGWLVKPENFAKVLEGRYEQRSAA
ncbi:MAG: hypothetical protein KGM99_13775 [Burkholderiales bacterium]|nr:hypothetical protein [Burkholderiales bacterium]